MRVGRGNLRARTLVAAALGLLGLIAAVRMVLVLSEIDGGWRRFRDQWRGAATGLAGRDRYRIPEQEPIAQARFWLEESRRILEDCDDPDLAEGAAWVLDSASLAWRGRYRSTPRFFPGADTGLELEAWQNLPSRAAPVATRAESDFERLCQTACRAAIEKATQLAPNDPERWRSRAWLTFRCNFANGVVSPRTNEWLSELDRCAAHDPGNALYDYLAAKQLWSESASRTPVNFEQTVSILDPEKYAAGRQRFAAAQAKPFLHCGATRAVSATHFLERTSLTPDERMMVLADRTFRNQAGWMAVALNAWQYASSDTSVSQGEFDAAEQRMQEVVRLGDQFDASPLESMSAHPLLRQFGLAELLEIAIVRPERVDPEDVAGLEERFREGATEYFVRDKAVTSVARSEGVTPAKPNSPSHDAIDAVILTWTQQTAILFLLIVAAGSAVLGFGIARPQSGAGPGWRTQFVAWTIGIGLTVVVFGLGPIEFFRRSQQTRFLQGFFWVAPILPAAGILWYWHRRRHGKLSDLVALALATATIVTAVTHPAVLRNAAIQVLAEWPSLLSVGLVLAVPCAVWWAARKSARFWRSTDAPPNYRAYLTAALVLMALWVAVGDLPQRRWGLRWAFRWLGVWGELPERNWLTPQSWDALPTSWLRTVARELHDAMPIRPIAWPFAMWSANYGHFLAAVLALSICFGASLVRQERAEGTGFWRRLLAKPRQRLAGALQAVARTAAVAAVFVFLAYVLTAPGAARALEADLRNRQAWYQDPTSRERDLMAAIAAVKADPALMAEVADRAEAWLIRVRENSLTKREAVRQSLDSDSP